MEEIENVKRKRKKKDEKKKKNKKKASRTTAGQSPKQPDTDKQEKAFFFNVGTARGFFDWQ